MSKIYAIDLFCGAGGLTHGLIQAGIGVIAGIDLDPD
ncbi:TPA: DNA cytosine methyltransferase, partial [Escherichia coli]